MNAPTRATVAGRTYLDLRNKARSDRRPVEELFQLYALEAFLARLALSPYVDRLVLKGGVLLAAFGERRPTRDVDLQAEALDNDADNVRRVICDIASRVLDDGLVFETEGASSEVIRDEDAYSGIRVSLQAVLATARLHFHVDVNVGDPITPAPRDIRLPRLLGGEVVLRGYPLEMVLAEKTVTAIARGTVNTRWRDFGDVYLLARHHSIDGKDLCASVEQVAMHRGVELTALEDVLEGYADIGQAHWAVWRRRQQLEDRLPDEFQAVVSAVINFADPAIGGLAHGRVWDPASGSWQ